MSSRRFAGIFIAIFLLGAFPLLLVQPSGAASAGLSAGFSAPVDHLALMLLFVAIGVWSSALGGLAIVALPLSVLFMLTIGAGLEFSNLEFPQIRFFILGAILLFGVALSMVRSRLYVLSVALFGSIAFHLGGYYLLLAPGLASPLYYLLGVLICKTLLIAIGISMGITLVEGLDTALARLREKPMFSGILSVFL